MNLAIQYPWSELERGQGFFVPCLTTASVREEGLRTALRLKLKDARGIEGIRGGLIGVWFYRKPPERK